MYESLLVEKRSEIRATETNKVNERKYISKVTLFMHLQSPWPVHQRLSQPQLRLLSFSFLTLYPSLALLRVLV